MYLVLKSNLKGVRKFVMTILKKNGEDGHRSHYLLHAKQALYHLSYIPKVVIQGLEPWTAALLALCSTD